MNKVLTLLEIRTFTLGDPDGDLEDESYSQ
ncbi:hypothetical protein LYNGBM3L_33150 [Moorena producens 3L]|uniref:Uncharacterized protein n=1 Tax=Moorena producens 3L TaxID=489825 RepID=F4XUA3_9CYAN|nr:hypothetical protein LYNGBM3L_33150 [Moorena producens 3L]